MPGRPRICGSIKTMVFQGARAAAWAFFDSMGGPGLFCASWPGFSLLFLAGSAES
jgi:hypothetical protein